MDGSVTNLFKTLDVIKATFLLHYTLMTVYWNMEILDKESAGVLKRPYVFIQVEAAVEGFYDTHNHLNKRIPLMMGIGTGFVYWR